MFEPVARGHPPHPSRRIQFEDVPGEFQPCSGRVGGAWSGSPPVTALGRPRLDLWQRRAPGPLFGPTLPATAYDTIPPVCAAGSGSHVEYPGPAQYRPPWRRNTGPFEWFPTSHSGPNDGPSSRGRRDGDHHSLFVCCLTVSRWFSSVRNVCSIVRKVASASTVRRPLRRISAISRLCCATIARARSTFSSALLRSAFDQDMRQVTAI